MKAIQKMIPSDTRLRVRERPIILYLSERDL